MAGALIAARGQIGERLRIAGNTNWTVSVCNQSRREGNVSCVHLFSDRVKRQHFSFSADNLICIRDQQCRTDRVNNKNEPRRVLEMENCGILIWSSRSTLAMKNIHKMKAWLLLNWIMTCFTLRLLFSKKTQIYILFYHLVDAYINKLLNSNL